MSAPIREWLVRRHPPKVGAALDRLRSTPGVDYVAVMPDVHLAQDVCVGVTLASREEVFPAAVGGDIGCGVATMRFHAEAAAISSTRDALRILEGLYAAVPQNRRLAEGDGLCHTEVLDEPLTAPRLDKMRRREGRVQFATLGRGNHFIELQQDDEGALWVMVHSGSRGMGPAVRDHHLQRASPRGKLHALLGASDEGREYLADMRWALAYAAANRNEMLQRVCAVLRETLAIEPDVESTFGCHHNFVRRERHFDEDLWIHRKGVISAVSGERGIIAGSMGAPSFHVTGRGHVPALCSASHGAGRALSRTEARRSIGARELDRQLAGVWYDRRRAAKLCDEAPGAYKDIASVMRAQRELVRIHRRVRPILSYKGV